ncbi:MAG: GNAT family N-acetyltransferase [Chitinivibrionales bacterium]|nr:GNAT family N-acetyltransferase [Chitinivibrionales bacterium]
MIPTPTTISTARQNDAPAILELQKTAFYAQGVLYDNFTLPPLTETLDEFKNAFLSYHVLKAEHGARIIGSVHAYEREGTCFIERLVVDPDYQNGGIGSTLMSAIENHYRDHVDRYELFTGHKSAKSLYLYNKLGYRIFRTAEEYAVPLCYLEKPNRMKAKQNDTPK